MKSPFKNLPDVAPFPHEYAFTAEHVLKQMEYNMRQCIWSFIEAAAITDPEGRITVRQVLMMAMLKQHEKVAAEMKEALASENEVENLLDDLGLRTEL